MLVKCLDRHRQDFARDQWWRANGNGLSLPREWDVTSSQWGGTKVQTLAFNTDRQLATVTAFGVTTQFDHDTEGLLSAIRHLPGAYSLGINKLENQTAHHSSAGGDYSNASVNNRLGIYASQDMDGRVGARSIATNDSLRTYTYNLDGTLATDERSVATTSSACSFDPASGRTCTGWAVNRVTGADDFTYDPVGNRLIGTYDGNRLTSAKGWTMEYDADGNVFHRYTTGVDQLLTWNTLGQLVQLTTGGETISYGYDAFGNRVRKDRTIGASLRYLYRGSDLAMELDATGVPSTEYAYLPGVDDPLTMLKGGEAYYFSRDKVSNSVNGLVRLRDNVVAAQYGYSAFGETRVVSDLVGNSLRYAAREYDSESGLYFNRARYYDPAMGRFISEDPIGIAGGVNQYAYASNDPINNTDPLGHECKTATVHYGRINHEGSESSTSTTECEGHGGFYRGKDKDPGPGPDDVLVKWPKTRPKDSIKKAIALDKACRDAGKAAAASFTSDLGLLWGARQVEVSVYAAMAVTGRMDIVMGARAAATGSAVSGATFGLGSYGAGAYFGGAQHLINFVPVIGSFDKLFDEVNACVFPEL